MHVFHAAVVQKMLCYILNLTDWNLDLIFFSGCIFFSALILG